PLVTKSSSLEVLEMELTITSIVKLMSLALAAGFAILGTTTDYKKDGKVTKWGRVAIIGVIVSGLLSSTLLGIEEQANANKRRQEEIEKIAAQNQANEDKAEINNKFENLVTAAQDNIAKTEKNLDTTKKVARDLELSVAGQKDLMRQTQDISGGVNQSIKQQGNILGQIQNQVALQEKTFEKTVGLQTQQGYVLENTLRALNSFKQFKVTYRLKFPLDTPSLQNFVKELTAFASSRGQNDSYPNMKIYDDGSKDLEDDDLEASSVDPTAAPGPVGANGIEAIEIAMDSPYFLTVKTREKEKIADLLTTSPVALKVYKDENAPIQKMDLIVRTDAWALTAEREKSLRASGPFSQSFKLT